ncbi:ABC transporter ATP-binding protein/permease [Clostridium sp. NSJ-6]|uniref:ABC transporter ATP-binding protein/permease n=1 Tax=Clostridium hominis TaxID=2763036 RepID=A0ABR7D8L4_9CLOT|nr:ABC transporter ATP-binding protein/permease [Clostridium hominis]MBC5627722.1 ABC transporter ATP-binding protein/permease [Clostridium hominis]MDU2673020.1 ABC transporter ATP-binding protein/permease [Clostridium sp.]
MVILKNLFKSFGEVKICDDVNYTFREKGLTCFFGPSGSGKTTIFNLIAGFDRSYKGEIEVNDSKLNGLSIEDLCKYRFNNIGFIFQNYNLFKGYTALENVLMGIHLESDITEGEKLKRALDLLNSLGLEEQKNQKIETLSGGQKQRVSIARALINEPNLILADEPTGALDSESTKAIMEILKDISKTKQVIMISHDEDVLEYADEVIELDDNKIKVIFKKEKDHEEVAIAYEVGDGKIKKEPKLDNKTAKSISLKNFKIHMFKFILAAVIIAFGSSAFVASLSTKKITNNIINDFKTKNFFYNIGTVPTLINGEKVTEDISELYDDIKANENLENVYYQYDLENLKIKNGDKSIDIPVKVPTAIAKETMAYGNIPMTNKNEIAISSNVANRITDDIKGLIGKEVIFEYINKDGESEEVKVIVSGLTNSIYQDFILSDDLEGKIYENAQIDKENPTAISFTVKDFEKIPDVEKELKSNDIGVFTKANEVEAFQKSFTSLLKLYTVLSYLILIVGLVISAIILYRVTIERYTEIGTLGALGYTKSNINKIIFRESVYFAGLSTIIAFASIFVFDLIYKMQFGYGIEVNFVSIAILVVINLGLTIGLSGFINNKLVKTEIVAALKS